MQRTESIKNNNKQKPAGPFERTNQSKNKIDDGQTTHKQTQTRTDSAKTKHTK